MKAKTKTCPLCNKSFQANNPLRIYCSESCSIAGRAQKIRKRQALLSKAILDSKKDRKCHQCGSRFQSKTCKKYCNPVCYAKAFEANRKKRLDAIKAVRNAYLGERTCPECREKFNPLSKAQSFCSSECNRYYWQSVKSARQYEREAQLP